MRIGSMVKQLLDEVKAAPLDDRSRERLAVIYQRSIDELTGALSPDLAAELRAMALPFDQGSVPSDAELRMPRRLRMKLPEAPQFIELVGGGAVERFIERSGSGHLCQRVLRLELVGNAARLIDRVCSRQGTWGLTEERLVGHWLGLLIEKKVRRRVAEKACAITLLKRCIPNQQSNMNCEAECGTMLTLLTLLFPFLARDSERFCRSIAAAFR